MLTKYKILQKTLLVVISTASYAAPSVFLSSVFTELLTMQPLLTSNIKAVFTHTNTYIHIRIQQYSLGWLSFSNTVNTAALSHPKQVDSLFRTMPQPVSLALSVPLTSILLRCSHLLRA